MARGVPGALQTLSGETCGFHHGIMGVSKLSPSRNWGILLINAVRLIRCSVVILPNLLGLSNP